MRTCPSQRELILLCLLPLNLKTKQWCWLWLNSCILSHESYQASDGGDGLVTPQHHSSFTVTSHGKCFCHFFRVEKAEARARTWGILWLSSERHESAKVVMCNDLIKETTRSSYQVLGYLTKKFYYLALHLAWSTHAMTWLLYLLCSAGLSWLAFGLKSSVVAWTNCYVLNMYSLLLDWSLLLFRGPIAMYWMCMYRCNDSDIKLIYSLCFFLVCI